MITEKQSGNLVEAHKIIWVVDGSNRRVTMSEKWLIKNLDRLDYLQLMEGYEIWKDVKIKGKYENRVFRRINKKTK